MMAIGWPVMIVYGLLVPRPDDLQALEIRDNEIPLLVGIAGGGRVCRSTIDCADVPAERSYIVLPRALSNGAVLVVTDIAGGSNAMPEAGGALIVLLVWLLCVYATWRFLIGPLTRHLTMRWSGS
jgi:hypothetical protein